GSGVAVATGGTVAAGCEVGAAAAVDVRTGAGAAADALGGGRLSVGPGTRPPPPTDRSASASRPTTVPSAIPMTALLPIVQPVRERPKGALRASGEPPRLSHVPDGGAPAGPVPEGTAAD